MTTVYRLTRWRNQYEFVRVIADHVSRHQSPMTTRQLARRVGYSETRTREWLREFEAIGLVQRVGCRGGWIAPLSVQLPVFA